MRRSLVASLVVGLLAPVSIGAAVTLGASQDTGCWDEYNNSGTRFYRTVAPKDLPLRGLHAGKWLLLGLQRDREAKQALRSAQSLANDGCDLVTATTSTTVPTTTPTRPPPVGTPTRFELQPVGAALPSDAECAAG